MSEHIDRLKAIVKELEAELESLDVLDADSQQVLEAALDELRTALGKRESTALASDSLAERLRAAEERFQVSHPTIAGLVLRMIDALGQLGI